MYNNFQRWPLLVAQGSALLGAFFLGRLSLSEKKPLHDPAPDAAALSPSIISPTSESPPGKSITAKVAGRRESGDNSAYLDSAGILLSDGAALRRRSAFQAHLQDMEPGDGPGLASALIESDKLGVFNGEEWGMLWARWAELDPMGAAEHYMGLGSGTIPGQNAVTRTWKAENIFNVWGTKDPQAALDYLESSPLAGNKEILNNLLQGWAGADPTAATEYILSLSNEEQKGLRFDMLVSGNARVGDSRAMTSWFAGLPNDESGDLLRSKVAKNLYRRLRVSDPQQAIDWVKSNLDETWMNGETIISTTSNALHYGDPDGAFSILSESKDNLVSQSQSDKIMNRIAQDEPEIISEWLEQNSVHPKFDRFAGGYAAALIRQRNFPEAAFWAAKIETETLREPLLNKLYLFSK